MCKKNERKFQKKYIFVTAMKNIVSYISGVLLVVMLSVSVAYAQNSMCFRQTTWNFGDIAEDGGKVTHTFTFVNNTNEPISILRVTATCGCTTPEYSKQPIMPGKQGAIDVTYDPMDRPGRFEKKVVVKNSLQQDIALVVEGRVIPRQKSVEELYPFMIGSGVRLSSNFHAFSYVGRGEVVEERIEWVNTSKRDVVLFLVPERTSGLLNIDYPKLLKAGASGEIVLRYTIEDDCRVYGTLNDVIGVMVDGQISTTKLSTNVIAVDRYDRMEEDITLPSIDISKKIVKFAEIKHPQSAKDSSIVITNHGESDLIIRAVEYPEESLDCSLKAGDRIKSGESREVTFTFMSQVCDYGPYSERVRIITNDVVHPMQAIRVTAIVVHRK